MMELRQVVKCMIFTFTLYHRSYMTWYDILKIMRCDIAQSFVMIFVQDFQKNFPKVLDIIVHLWYNRIKERG